MVHFGFITCTVELQFVCVFFFSRRFWLDCLLGNLMYCINSRVTLILCVSVYKCITINVDTCIVETHILENIIHLVLCVYALLHFDFSFYHTRFQIIILFDFLLLCACVLVCRCQCRCARLLFWLRTFDLLFVNFSVRLRFERKFQDIDI